MKGWLMVDGGGGGWCGGIGRERRGERLGIPRRREKK